MSIKLNNQIIAGLYESQVVPQADTVNSGMIRIATQKEVDDGTDNTTAVTPFYLKQNVAENVKADGVTIVKNDDNSLTVIGQKSINNIITIDWIGTKEEYETAWNNKTITSTTVCYITDDEEEASIEGVLFIPHTERVENGIIISWTNNQGYQNPDPVLIPFVENNVPLGGTTGQILAKKSDSDYILEWIDNDYSLSKNKPQINNIELIGNKTLDELNIQIKGDYATIEELNTKVDISDLSNVATSGNYEDLENKPLIPSKTSDLVNDSGFINGIPDEYITEEELNSKGYITEIPDTVQLKLDNTLNTTSKTVVGGINELVNKKVDKEDGKSLISDTEIVRLSGVTNYDDTSVVNNIADLQINKSNTSLDNLTPEGEKHFLNYSQVTNCITEIPQDIKLELNNGVLTLKAGSELTYGDGRTIVIENDIAQTNQVNATLNGLILIHEPSSNGFGVYIQGANATSGATPPTIATGTVDYIWFDTNTNQMKISHDTQATWKEIPLPIGVVDITPNTYTALKHVFNGFGYIGSTVFVTKGVKGLIPNGRNEDGSLKNIEYVTSTVITKTFNSTSSGWVSLENNNSIHYDSSNYIVYSTDEPTKATYLMWFNPQTNKWQQCINDSWGVRYRCPIVQVDFSSSATVEKFTPKLPFRAVDYNDKSVVSGWGMPSSKSVDLTLGASGTTYTAPANGFYSAKKVAGVTNAYFNLHNITSGLTSQDFTSVANNHLRLWLPCKKGDLMQVEYSATGNTIHFRFIYAEGEI